jgi:hypothetical protein
VQALGVIKPVTVRSTVLAANVMPLPTRAMAAVRAARDFFM